MKIQHIVLLLLTAVISIACSPQPQQAETEPENKPMTTPIAESIPTPTPDPNANHLINEKSPYLQQHAHNPIDWYPWGEEAFAKARAENKPIFLSIGYASCHWCHVMEEESFSDPEIGQLMNDTFIAIKVDREERPDIDNIYMNVAMMMNDGGGGWPLNIIMTPEQEPFFAATYIPKEARYGRAGLLNLIPQIDNLWKTEPERAIAYANQVADAIKQPIDGSGTTPTAATLALAAEQFASQFDAVNGGFGTAPKFPSPQNHLFLLRSAIRTGDGNSTAMVEAALQAMRNGGIFDHVGYGFHRYSVDAAWFAPHFEKMLYDQAMLTMAYTEAYLATDDEQYAQTSAEILTYVMRDMTAPEGGFYSSEDADSEGEEGKFYLWTEAELEELLSADDAAFVAATFNTAVSGNFSEAGELSKNGNILYLKNRLSAEDAARWETIRPQLFDVREQRIHPALDDKVLTDWNGLMIAAFAQAGQAMDEPTYTAAAKTAADFILETMVDENGRLLHRYRDGEAGISATIEDYAFLIWGLLDLYQATFDLRYLEEAIRIQAELDAHFWDQENDGYFFTADDAEQLISRPKESYDGAIPSGNSAAALNLVRLGRMTGNTAYEERASALMTAFGGNIARSPMGHAMLLTAVDFGIGPSHEIVVVGDAESADTAEILAAIRSLYLPNKVVMLRPMNDEAATQLISPFTEYQSAQNNAATVYVCQNFFCERPTTETAVMLELLGR